MEFTPSKNVPARVAALPIPSSSDDGLRRYLHEISQFPILKPEEELALSKRWREEGDVSAAHRLVTSHLRLVAKIAFKFKGYGLPMSDLIAEGNIGLMKAVKGFEPERGFKLATYAIWWIRAAIQEYILRSWSLVKVGSSAAQKRLFFNLNRLKKKIGAHDARGLTDAQAAEIAGTLDVDVQEVKDMNQRMTGSDVYLNSATSEDGESEKMDFLADTAPNQEVILAEQQEKGILRKALKAALSKLNPRERDIILRRRMKDEPDTLEDLSQAHKISRERVRQIEVAALAKLQKEMGAAA